MKTFLLLIYFLLSYLTLFPQNNEPAQPVTEQKLETLTEKEDAETNDDSYWQMLEQYHKHPINLNTARQNDLEELQLLTDLQIQSFMIYRNLFGRFLSLYELQAIPGWGLETIRNILPYVTIKDQSSLHETIEQRLKGGDNSILARVSEQIEKSKGFEQPEDPNSNHYLGSPQKIFVRYKYNYKNLLQYGLLGDKDAGEEFFKGSQKKGFDFYSFHFFTKNTGIIKSLALGDFTVNLGQGLIQWQSLAFTKSADVLAIKRQSPVLRPYNSSGEFNFHRGAGMTLKIKNWETTAFVSARNVSANLVTDTLSKEDFISSFESSGYHRTEAEIADKNSLHQTTFGGNVNFAEQNYKIGINVIRYHFSKPIQKQDLPYNLYSIGGSSWNNESIDYSFTYRNIHFFGEAALDNHLHLASVNGLLASISQNADLSFLYRKIDKASQSLYANAFTENTTVNNETGFYSGISIHPFAGWKLDAYIDLYQFSWLKYEADAPSSGKDYLVQLIYQPNKIWFIYSRYKNESKQQNVSAPDLATHHLAFVPKQDWRTEIGIHVSKQLELRQRAELLWYDRNATDYEQGFMGLIDLFYSSFRKKISGNIRLQYFETGGYHSRIYTYENDVLFNYSIPSFYGKGFRYYLNLNYSFKNLLINENYKMNAELWFRWSQTIYSDQTTIGTGLDEINGNKKSEIKFQFIFYW